MVKEEIVSRMEEMEKRGRGKEEQWSEEANGRGGERKRRVGQRYDLALIYKLFVRRDKISVQRVGGAGPQ